MLQPGLRPRLVLLALLTVGGGLIAGCADDALPDSTPPPPPPDLISRDTFVKTYVELRFVALDRGMQEPAIEDRDAVLEEFGVSGEDLFKFIEFYGPYIQYMREIWDEIEATVDRGRPTEESGPPPSPTG